MDPVFIVVSLLGGVAGMLALAFAWEKWCERQRSQSLAVWASGLGFSIDAGPRPPAAAGLASGLASRPVFARGRNAHLANIMEGHASDGHVIVMDHVYVTGSGKSSTTVSHTMLAVELPPPPMPEFAMAPEGVFARIGQVFGAQDIDLEGNPVFSGAYQLKGRDEEAIRRLFERTAAAYFAEHHGWSVEAAGSWILAYRHGKRVKVADMSAFLDQALTVVRVFAAGER
jgi:hypothetical protein